MSRIRTIKPEMAKHELLYDLELETGLPIRFAFAVLPTACDREGRFQWRPRTLKADILPHDPVDFSRVLDAWLTRGFIVRYRVGNEWFGWVPTFRKHQVVNVRETASILPSVEDAEEVEDYRNQDLGDACATRKPREDDATATREVHARGEGKGREGKGSSEANASGAFAPRLPDGPTGTLPGMPEPTPQEPEKPTARDLVFVNGVTLLTAAGITDKNARSFLAAQCKSHGEDAVLLALTRCADERPIQPVAWLQAALKAIPAAGRRSSGPGPAEPEWRREQRDRIEAFAGPAAAKRRPTTIEAQEVTDVLPLRLG